MGLYQDFEIHVLSRNVYCSVGIVRGVELTLILTKGGLISGD